MLRKSPLNDLEDHQTRAEDRILLLSGIPILSEERTEELRDLIGPDLDWERLVRSARRHRVVPLLYRALTTTSNDLVPHDVLEDLRISNLLNARRNVLLARELIRVIDSMEDMGIPAIPFKGPLLASFAYGDLFLRQFDDLDILIPPDMVGKSDEILVSLGYREEGHRGTASKAREAAMMEYQHHHHFYNPETRVHIEAHWSLSPRLYSLNQDTTHLWDRSEPVALLDREMRSLSREDTLVLICDHAARHRWNRLSWISDVAAILGSKHLDWDRVMDQACKWRAQRALLLGVHLANITLDAPLCDDVGLRVLEDQEVSPLASEAIDDLFADDTDSDLSKDAAQQNIQDQLFYIKARDTFSDKLRLYFRLVTTPTVEDWDYIPLPDSLFPLYSLVRPVRQARAYRLRILDWLLK